MQRQNLFAVLLTVLLIAAVYAAWHYGLFARLSDHEELVGSMRQSTTWGPLICVGIQFLQVVIFAIPGEITQVAAGYVFGAWQGFVYSVAGIMLGSAFNYSFARLVGRPLVQKLVGGEALQRVDRTLESPRGKSALFILFLLPGLPKDAMSYAAGLSSLPLGEFVVLSGLARTPALLFSTMIGSQLYQRDYGAVAIIVLIGVLAVGAFYFYERKRTRNDSPDEQH